MKKKILVVDDDRLVADTLRLVYKANGYDSEATYSAEEGLSRARTYNPQLVLCDVTMPDGNGLLLAEKLRSELPGVQVLMLSAYSSNMAKVDAHSSSTGHPLKLLSKPCRPEELLYETSLLLKSA